MKDMKKDAKMDMLKSLKKMAKEMMYQDMPEEMKGMKKITVMSDDEEGLKEGLSKAEEIMKMREEVEGEEEFEEDEYEDDEMGDYEEVMKKLMKSSAKK